MAENKGFIKNLELLAYHNLNEIPGFQMAMQRAKDRWYLYITGRVVPGWHNLDVTEPSNPKYLQFLKGPANSGTLKMQVANGVMITSMHGAVEGIYIWDVKMDPENPKFLSHWSTGEANGSTHRFFYSGGRYVHLTSTCKGFAARIYRIIDIIDPQHHGYLS